MTNKLPKPPSRAELVSTRKPLRNVNKQFTENITGLNKFAVWITDRVGTIGFFLIIAAWTTLWLGWNLLAPKELQFDPPMGFVFWLFISNLIQILLMPLIMVGQSLQSRHAELRAEYDLEVTMKEEQEIEVILHHLEYQNAMLMSMLEKMGISLKDIATTIKSEHK